ncbi:MAG: hypothetical protein AAB374_00310 [Patescibacteria group bacterium]
MTSAQTSSKLYIALIVLIGLVGGYIMYSQWIQPAEIPVPPPAISTQDSPTTLKNIKIDFKVLDDSVYKALITSGESPVNPGATGKKDIFAP